MRDCLKRSHATLNLCRPEEPSPYVVLQRDFFSFKTAFSSWTGYFLRFLRFVALMKFFVIQRRSGKLACVT